jgi:uncharacterized membrane protein YoaK (UPF0700 family)
VLTLTPDPADGADSPARPATPAKGSLRHPLTRTLLVLTFSTGLVDGASYLGLGHVFAANMTGNIVLLGFGIAGAGGLPVVAPIVSLVGFLVGAGIGGAAGRRWAEQHRRHLAFALVIEGGMLLAATIVAAAVSVRAGAFSGDLVIALLATGMGARNATVKALAMPDLTTTVLTMTLTGLAADSRLTGGSGAGTLRRSAAVGVMLAGALVGALLLKTSLPLVLGVATVLALATLVADAGPLPRSTKLPR